MRSLVILAVVLIVVGCVGCGEDNPLESQAGDIKMRIEKVEAIEGKGIFPIMHLAFYLVIENQGKETGYISQSDFHLQDIRGSIIHNTSEVVLFDPEVDSPAEALITYYLGDKLIEVELKPGNKVSVGVYTSYYPEGKKGELYLVYSRYIKIPVQTIIDQSIKAQKEERARLEAELAAIDLDNIDVREYFPLKTGNSWEYKVSASGTYARDREETCKMELGKAVYIKNELPEFHLRESEKSDVPGATFFASPPDYYAISGNRILYHIDPSPWGKFGFRVFLAPEMVIGKEIISVPAGTFACIKIVRDNSCNQDILSLQRYISPTDLCPLNEWYTKGIGMVRREIAIDYLEKEYSLHYEEPAFRQVLTKYNIK